MDTPDPVALRATIAGGVSRDALVALDRLFPERCADPGDTYDQIMFKAGQRHVIRLLLSLQEPGGFVHQWDTVSSQPSE